MRLRGLPGVLLLTAILLFVVPSAVSFYTDWLWFRELGYEGVFLRSLNAQTAVFASTFAAVYLFLFLNLRFARKRTNERPRVMLGTGGGAASGVGARHAFAFRAIRMKRASRAEFWS